MSIPFSSHKENEKTLIHASCVAIQGRGVLLVGPSGSGKSDLTLRLIDGGAMLVSDDQTEIERTSGGLIARPAPTLRGLLEVRNLGIVHMPYCTEAPVELYVELCREIGPLERLPEKDSFSLLDHSVRKLKLNGLEASAPNKVRVALEGCLYDPSFQS